MAWPSLVESAVVANTVGLVYFFVKGFFTKNDKKNDEVNELKTEVAILTEKYGNLKEWVASVSSVVKETASENRETAKNLAALTEAVGQMEKRL